MCHARATKKNNVMFYKLIYVSFQRTQHPSLEKFCCEGHNISFLKEQTLWDKYMLCTAKYCSNILFPKKSLCHIDIAASKNMNQTSKDEEPKHRHTKKTSRQWSAWDLKRWVIESWFPLRFLWWPSSQSQ